MDAAHAGHAGHSAPSALPWNPYSRSCPSRDLLDRISNRWVVLVIGVLAAGPQRFTGIAQRVEGVSQRMLTQTLRGLERDGFVVRTAYAEVPPRVEYELTESGRSLAALFAGVEVWIAEHMSGVLTARTAYDARVGA